MNTTRTVNAARLLSFAFATLLTLGTLTSVGGLAHQAEQSAQSTHWAQAHGTATSGQG